MSEFPDTRRILIFLAILSTGLALFVIGARQARTKHETGSQTFSTSPIFKLDKYPVVGVPVSEARTTDFLKSVVASAWGQPTSGVCMHMVRLRDVAARTSDEELERRVLAFEDLLTNI